MVMSSVYATIGVIEINGEYCFLMGFNEALSLCEHFQWNLNIL